MASAPVRGRRVIVPEVIQTSALDCGPASLASLLSGHGIDASYAELRERCYTDVDGTSIDALEELAGAFGLDACQAMLPVDHVFHPDARVMPAIAVASLPSGAGHFIVLWRRVGPWVQVMDPGAGRLWSRTAAVASRLYVHEMQVAAADWRSSVESDEFVGPLSDRMLALGMREREVAAVIDSALRDPGWRPIAGLDATTRLVRSLLDSGALRRGDGAARVLRALNEATSARPQAEVVPARYWYARQAATPEKLVIRGAVIMQALGSRRERPSQAPLSVSSRPAEPLDDPRVPEREAASTGVLREIFGYVRRDGLLAPSVLALAMAMAGVTTFVQGVTLNAVVEVGRLFGVVEYRMGALVAVAALAAIVLLLESRAAEGLLALGRRLEVAFRIDFLRKLVVLPEQFFRSRLTSDLTERIQRVPALRGVPELGGRLIETLFGLLFTTAGIVWLDPACAPYAVGAAACSVALPLAFRSLLAEQQMTVATYQGGLTRFHLDALRGSVPLRTHAGQQALRSEHEDLMTGWGRARLRLLRTTVLVNGLVLASGMALAGVVLYVHLSATGDTSTVLLLVFWAQQLPILGQTLVASATRYLGQRAVAARLLEPLHAADESPGSAAPAPGSEPPARNAKVHGVALRFRDVGVAIRGRDVLSGVDLEVAAGRHVALVGSSGAGKTTLLALLLGWHTPTSGRIEVDDLPLDGERLDALRAATAWLDPAIQLWNRPLIDNLRYGSAAEVLADLHQVTVQAELQGVIEKLPEGLNTVVGEGGCLLSEGEGQRVRLGRAMLRRTARLVLLDEPFRGLDRAMREQRLAEARSWWRASTLLCVTHDPWEALGFDRVVVLEGGRVVEQGEPAVLRARGGSRFGELLTHAADMQALFKDDAVWRRVRVRDGAVVAEEGRP